MVGRTPSGLIAALVASGALALAGCGEDEQPGEPTTTNIGGGPASECEQVEEPAPKRVKLKAPRERVAGEEITATVETSCGDFELALDTSGSPRTASSFVHMVEAGLYEGTGFHRVVADFVIQGGDPAADGSGGPGYSITEKVPIDTEYTRGTVAMAKTAAEPPGTSGSQFFVVTAADAGLPTDYAVLGELTSGERTVEAIESLADPGLGSAGGPPLTPVVIERITLD